MEEAIFSKKKGTHKRIKFRQIVDSIHYKVPLLLLSNYLDLLITRKLAGLRSGLGCHIEKFDDIWRQCSRDYS